MYRQYRPLERGEFIVVGCDTASGGLDRSVAQFVSKTHVDVPLVYQSEKTTSYMTNALVPVLEKIHEVTGNAPIIAYERNNGGTFEMDRLAHLNKLGKFKLYMQKVGVGSTDSPQEKKYGWTTNSATRPKMLEDLKEAVDNRVLKIYDEQTINELFSFIVVKTSSSWRAQAEQYAHDDMVFGLAIAWQLFQTEQVSRPIHIGDLPKFTPRDEVIGI